MSNEVNNNYTLDVLQIHSLSGGIIDLKPFMINLEIYEDIHSPFLQAQVDIYETQSIVEILPIVGDEWVFCSLRYHGMHNTENKFVFFYLDVYKVEDEQLGDHKQTMFRLKLISQSFKKNAAKRNRKYYIGTQDFIASEICLFQLQKPIIRIDPSLFEEEYIFPNWHPVSCINYMAKNAKSAIYGDSDYVFYEDMEGFHFVSMSYMLDPIWLIFPSYGPRFKSVIPHEFKDEKTDFNVSDYHKKHSFDIVDNTNRGMYGMTLIHHDVTNRKWREDGDNYMSTFGNFLHNESVPLTILANAGNEKNRMLYVPFNGVENPGVYQDIFYRDQRKQLIIRQMQTEQNTMILEIDGEVEMKVGRPLDFELFSIKGNLEDNPEEHKKLTGKFLVTKIRHLFDREFYRQYVEMSKDTYKE